jgi:hypothetical protein
MNAIAALTSVGEERSKRDGGNVGRWQKGDRCCQVLEDIDQETGPPPGIREPL